MQATERQNVPSSSSRDALRGAIWGIVPGAISCVSYGCHPLSAQGDLAAVTYEKYIIPTFAAAGAVVGLVVGARIGWIAAIIKQRSIGRQLCSWLTNGSVAGIVLANLLVFMFWLTPHGGDGASPMVDIIDLDLGGLSVGAISALVVGLVMWRESP
jgi:hypothetical protein